jgi:hypothetical protein
MMTAIEWRRKSEREKITIILGIYTFRAVIIIASRKKITFCKEVKRSGGKEEENQFMHEI